MGNGDREPLEQRGKLRGMCWQLGDKWSGVRGRSQRDGKPVGYGGYYTQCVTAVLRCRSYARHTVSVSQVSLMLRHAGTATCWPGSLTMSFCDEGRRVVRLQASGSSGPATPGSDFSLFILAQLDFVQSHPSPSPPIQPGQGWHYSASRRALVYHHRVYSDLFVVTAHPPARVQHAPSPHPPNPRAATAASSARMLPLQWRKAWLANSARASDSYLHLYAMPNIYRPSPLAP